MIQNKCLYVLCMKTVLDKKKKLDKMGFFRTPFLNGLLIHFLLVDNNEFFSLFHLFLGSDFLISNLVDLAILWGLFSNDHETNKDNLLHLKICKIEYRK
jgi:hypothetical protein